MSHICLQFGQCGNQLGCELFSLIYEDITDSNDSKISNSINDCYRNISLDNWFTRNDNSLHARAILFDTEEKVINDITQLSGWSFDPGNIIIDNSGGSANNWAIGYNVIGPQILDKSVEALRKESERCDRLQGFLCINSSAGGSGSGISSYLTQHIQDEFYNKTLISALVLPYVAGEVVTQSYNSLFTLSKLNNSCDGILLFQNDHLHSVLTYGQVNKNIEFKALNRLITQQVGSVLQPILNNSDTVRRLRLSDLTSHLCAHPSYKLLTIKTAPHLIQNDNFKFRLKWSSLEQCEVEMCKQNNRAIKNFHNKVVANVLINRGKTSIIPSSECKSHISTSSVYSNWSQKLSSLQHYFQSRKYMKMDQYVTLVTNNSSVQFDLDQILESAWNSFINQSYVYLYEKHDISKEDFLEAFSILENISKIYKDL